MRAKCFTFIELRDYDQQFRVEAAHSAQQIGKKWIKEAKDRLGLGHN